jgi:HPt (histidine-containing phosphotransfer) domain-containing protein
MCGVVIQEFTMENVILPEVFDRLRQATTKDPAVLVDLCREYIEEARKTMSQLRDAFLAKDAAAFRDRAHYLKGSSLMVGAGRLAQCCAILERMGRDSDFRGAEPMLEDTAAALREVEAQLAEQVGPAVLPAEGSAA